MATNLLMIRGSTGPAVQLLRRALAAELGADAAPFPRLATGSSFDADTEAALRRWQSGVGLIADGICGPYTAAVLGLRKPAGIECSLDLHTVRPLFPATKPANIARYLPYVASALQVLGLTDQPMVVAALATIRAESEGFLPIAELPSSLNTKPGMGPFSAYAGRLGNGRTGDDAARFRGRGFVQLTGRANYTLYGQRLGIEAQLLANPDLANAPDIAALLLATFLAEHADAMRQALAQGDLPAARRLVNGGAHGLDRFASVFALAAQQAPGASAVAAAADADSPVAVTSKAGRTAARAAKATAPAAKRKRTLNVKRDPADLRDRPYVPPPVSLVAEFPTSAEIKRYMPAYRKAGLVLDQGQEGACTGYGLACVINHLRWLRAGGPATFAAVSPEMLYTFARRYDEYAGEDYEGSSCRGALKGWFNHGVCLQTDWPSGPPGQKPRYGYAQRAAATTLGVYLRIDLGSITDLQAAIQQVGAVYVSAFTHDGWSNVPWIDKAPTSHEALPVIAFDGKPSTDGGHSFALVGFNTHGFVLQNSWGKEWGLGGFAVLSYADWLANAMDAWVAAIGVPGVVVGRVGAPGAGVSAGAAAAGVSNTWWSEDLAYRHSVVLGDDGRVKRYLTEDEPTRTLLTQAATLPDQWFRTQAKGKTKRLLVYAHGGLNSEADAIRRARALGRHIVANDAYPLFLVWRTGLLESIGDIVSDALRRTALAGRGVGDWLTDQSDLLIEKTVGRQLARPIWTEMKDNAGLAFGASRGGDLLVTALGKLIDTWGDDFELHLVGHSAGSILLGHMATALAARGMTERVKTISLLAPACTVQFANEHYALQPALMQRLSIESLADVIERGDNVAGVYRKSLLYLVSSALEADLRTPIVGMAKVYDENFGGWDGTSSTAQSLKTWRAAAQAGGLYAAGAGATLGMGAAASGAPAAPAAPAASAGQRLRAITADKVLTARPNVMIPAAHGSFDNDIDVMERVLTRMLGGPLLAQLDDLRGY